jgi:hypothetical protein
VITKGESIAKELSGVDFTLRINVPEDDPGLIETNP